MKPEELTDDAIDYIFENINEDYLNPWEKGFIGSVRDQWNGHHRDHGVHWLSEKQKETLGKIWDKQP